MRDSFAGSYDATLCLEMYKTYRESRDDALFNELLHQICPLIRHRFNLEVRKTREGDRVLFEGEALSDLSMSLPVRAVTVYNPGSFTKYLIWQIRGSFTRTSNRIKPKIFPYEVSSLFPFRYHNDDSLKIEGDIYRKQLDIEVCATAKKRIRFPGKWLKFCERCIDFIVTGKKSALFVRQADALRHNDRERLENFLKYCNFLVRSVSLEIYAREKADWSFCPDWKIQEDRIQLEAWYSNEEDPEAAYVS